MYVSILCDNDINNCNNTDDDKYIIFYIYIYI